MSAIMAHFLFAALARQASDLAVNSQPQAVATPSKKEIAERLRAREGDLDHLYLEYTIHERVHDLVHGIPDALNSEVRYASDSNEYRVAWFRKGLLQYWEVLAIRPKSFHYVYWNDGEAWHSFDWNSGSGSISQRSPALNLLQPDAFLRYVDGRSLSDLVDQATVAWITEDTRYKKERHWRVEIPLPATFPPRRAMMAIGEGTWRPSRVYTIGDDYLEDDYELKETRRLSSGAIVPTRFRLFSTYNTAINHFVVPKQIVEADAELSYISEDSACGPDVEHLVFLPGTVVTKSQTDQRFIVGNDFDKAHCAWRLGPVEAVACQEESPCPEWYWQLAGAHSAFPTQMISLREVNEQLRNNCGPLALSGIMAVLGMSPEPMKQLADLCKCDGTNTSAANLVAAANSCGLELVALRSDDKRFADLRQPFIGVVKARPGEESDHYVLVEAVTHEGEQAWRVSDFPDSVRTVASLKDVPRWLGIGLFPRTAGVEEWIARRSRQHVAWIGALIIAGVALLVPAASRARHRGSWRLLGRQ